MSGVVTAALVARKFLEEANGNDCLLTPLKLMKLVYISQGFHLALYDESLVDDQVHAFPNGPVFPDLFFALDKFEDNVVTEVPVTDQEVFLIKNNSLEKLENLDGSALKIIEFVSKRYRKKTGEELSKMTHEEGSPWDMTCRKYGGYDTGPVITKDEIKNYYTNFLEP